MRKLIIAALVASTGLFASNIQAAEKVTSYTLDPTHTQVLFAWDHFGFSAPSAIFKNIQGEIKVSDPHPENSSVSVSIPVETIDTGVALLNEHLLTKPEYFKAKQYPTISFNSTSMINVDHDEQEFDLVGVLTVNGISKEVTLDTEIKKMGEHPMWDNAQALGIDATTTIKRSDFGMGNYAPAVGDELEVKITLEAIETKGYEKKLKSMQ
jgi:polyisoprenoid-binding protein YceI